MAAALYLGRSTVDQVRAAAELGAQEDIAFQRCAANFYIGEWQLAHNDAVSARISLQAAASGCPPDELELEAAKLELGRMSVAESKT